MSYRVLLYHNAKYLGLHAIGPSRAIL